MSPTVKWLGALLLVSLAANVFIGGFLLGREFGDRPHPRHAHRHVERPAALHLELRALSKTLPEEAREELRASFKERKAAMAPVVEQIHATRQRIVELLEAEDLDETALEAAFAELSGLFVELQRPVHGTLMETAKTMSAEQRRHLAEAIERLHARAHKPRERRNGS